MKEKEIESRIKKVQSNIDYEVGDWVETCNMMPAIVQKIENYYDYKRMYFEDTVTLYYPNRALYLDNPEEYTGGGMCSITNCGVHKISEEYAKILLIIGSAELSELWREVYLAEDNDKEWKDIVIEYYNNNYTDDDIALRESSPRILKMFELAKRCINDLKSLKS